ncbi:MAG: hypothetical protein ILP11_02935 [Alphaproteobacteria bacterium]|nr:hypothetical protein [Alphaproteobacteria bacterium]
MKYALYAFMLLLCSCSLFEPEQPKDPNLLTFDQACSLYQLRQKDRLATRVQDLFDAARGDNLLFCDADPSTQKCVAPAMRMNAKVGATDTLIEMPKAKLLAVDKKVAGDSLFFDYYFNVNHTYPVCRAAKSSINFADCENAIWYTQPFQCDFANTGKTNVTITYRIVYINFIQKKIGAYYDINVSGISQGSRTGYTLIQFPKDPIKRDFDADDLDEIQFTVDDNGQLVSYTMPISM